MRLSSFDLTVTQARALEVAFSDRAPGSLVAVHTLDGDLDVPRLRAAVAGLSARTSIFGRGYVQAGGRWTMIAGSDVQPELAEFDLRSTRADAAISLVDELTARTYRPENAPLARFSLIHRDGPPLLVFTAASWLIDRFSLRAVLEALSLSYATGSPEGPSIDLDQEQLLLDERDYLDSEAGSEARRFWTELMRDRRTLWTPPRWVDATAQQSITLAMPPAVLARVAELTAATGVPAHRLLGLLFHLYLQRLTGGDSIVTGGVRRIGADPSELTTSLPVGYSESRTLLVSVPRSGHRLFDFLAESHWLADYALHHSHLPADEVLTLLRGKDRDLTRFTNVNLAVDHLPHDALRLPGVHSELLGDQSRRLGTSDVTLTISTDRKPSLIASVRDSAIMPSVRRSMEHFMSALDSVCRDLDRDIADIDWMDEEQRRSALLRSENPAHGTPEATFHSRLVEQARTNPGGEAVRCREESLTYAELLAAADELADDLRPHLAGLVDPLVGICLPRGIDMIVALVAIGRAGAGYVPLDPTNPPERLAFILDDAAAAAVVADSETGGLVPDEVPHVAVPTRERWERRLGTPPHVIDEDLASTAYVIYTSGTTGLPKGVVVERRNLAAFIAACDEVAACGPGDRWMQFASLNFDASVLEIANCMPRGATLVVAPAESRTDPEAVADLLEGEQITHAFIPPAMLRSLPHRDLPRLTDVYVGGEASDDLTVAYWSRAVRLWNAYGPTETTVKCSAKRMGDQRSAADLGGPLPGYSMYVLDPQLRLVPHGATGEIWIGGPAVTRGYLGREELTTERFVPNPFGEGRMYRTGDLARHFPNGDLEYLGRNDFQVKIRGFRIELGDIEAAIRDVAGVTGVYVTVLDGATGKSLGAWYTASSSGPEAEQVAAAIGRQLPHYMVPPHLVRMDSFPVNISGKVDRSRLPMPGAETGPVSQAPLTPLERAVREVWSDVLNTPEESIGSDSNFFHLGGHSLAAAVACHRITERLGSAVAPRALFEHPVLGDFCTSLIDARSALPIRPLEPSDRTSAPVPGALPSMMLKRAAQFGSDTAYTIAMRIDFAVGIDTAVLRRAMRELVESDPVFRSSFRESGARTEMLVDPDARLSVGVIVDADIDALIEEYRDTAFDLSRAPLWRADIAVTDGGTSLLLAIHHGIFDGWSLTLLLEELGERYAACLEGLPYVRSAPTMLDFGVWLDSNEELRRDALDYWTAKLADASARTELPSATGVNRPDSNRSVVIDFDPAVTAALRTAATAADVTTPPVLFAAYITWLWRLTGQSELVVAYPYAGRDVPGSERVYGMFVSMGFLRVKVDPDEPFLSLVRRVASQMVDDREHLIASPYDADLSRTGAPNLLFSLQSGIGLEATHGGVQMHAHEYPSRSSKADIAGIFYETAEGALEGRLEYDASALDPTSIPAFVESLQGIVQSLVAAADSTVADLPYLPDRQRRVIDGFSVGEAPPDGPVTLVESLMATAAARPDAVAVEAADRVLTYAELDAATERLARVIVAATGPARNRPIGLSVGKSSSLIVAALAILRAGGGYVPLDPHYPADRLRYIIEDSGLTHVIADKASEEILRGCGAADIEYIDPRGDDLLAVDSALPMPDPRDLAYVIYTSGSTGRPKGVMIEHRTVPRMIRASAQTLRFGHEGRMVLLGTLNFDASVMQVFIPLLSGGTLVVPPADTEKEPEGLHRFLDDNRVTHAVVTPSLIRNLPQRPLPSLQVLGFGGEAIDAATAAYWCQQTSFWSLYGPTETTVMCSAGEILPGANSRVIGRPLPGYTLRLVDRQLQPVPLGAVGEIVISGGGAARGYLGRPDLTIERFIPDPSGRDPLDVAYRSGDLGRFLADGTIEYLGRNDDQVKLRGFRIEMGEIESALQSADGVEQAAAMVRGEGDLRAIVGYVTGEAGLSVEDIRHHCQQVLPEYMVPSVIVVLDVLPLNANGKLDRRALPDVTFQSTSEPPREGLERQIAQVWEDLLHLQGIGREDDFFRLGGNSLLVARLQTALRERLGIEMSTADFYAAPVIAGIAGQGGEDVIGQAVKAALAGVSVGEPVAAERPLDEPVSTVLLTGAAGFLGSYLLEALLRRVDRVVCLVRAADEQTARRNLQAACAALDVDFDRVDIVVGDLGVPDLGLDVDTQQRLADSIDLIVHCGAWVHHLYSYATLKPTNVDSTAALVRLALRGRRSSLCFVSTESVAEGISGSPEVAEAVLDPAAHPPTSDVGYLLTKWVAEQAVADASRRYGLEALVARPGNITGDSRTGYSNYASNHFWLFTKGCLEMGAVPAVPNSIEMTPVDVLAEAIAAMALNRTRGLRVANLSNPATVSWPDFLLRVGQLTGVDVAVEEPVVWQRRLADLHEDSALWSLRDFYTGDLDAATQPVQRSATAEMLNEASASIEVHLDDLIPRYVDYLAQEGFWPR